MTELLLGQVARHGRLLLIAGLVAGIASPALALAMRPLLPWLIAGLLFLAALRVGPRSALAVVGGVRTELPRLMSGVAELAVPLAVELGVGPNWEKAH